MFHLADFMAWYVRTCLFVSREAARTCMEAAKPAAVSVQQDPLVTRVAEAQPRLMFSKSHFCKKSGPLEELKPVMCTWSVVMMGNFVVPFHLPRAEISLCCFLVAGHPCLKKAAGSCGSASAQQWTGVKSSNQTSSWPEQSPVMQTVACAIENSSLAPHAC